MKRPERHGCGCYEHRRKKRVNKKRGMFQMQEAWTSQQGLPDKEQDYWNPTRSPKEDDSKGNV